MKTFDVRKGKGMQVIQEKQNLRNLNWSHVKTASGVAGTLIKSQSILNGEKKYYKLSNFDNEKGVVGLECINEIIVDRLLEVLGVDHLSYTLINAEIDIDGRIFNTYICESIDFKKPFESKIALDDYYRLGKDQNETPYEFCKRNGFQKYIDEMLAVDYIICNRDRHGANIEVLRNQKEKSIRIAPLFDHGLSLLLNSSEKELESIDIFEEKKCNNFIGSSSCFENLKLIENKKEVFKNQLKESDKEFIFKDLDMISSKYIDKVWEFIFKRYRKYESL